LSTTDETTPAQWTVSISPHIRERETTSRIMWSVVAALAPAGAWSFYVFGPAVLYVVLLSVGTCVITEWVCQRLRGRRATLEDGSAVVTGLLLAYVLPSHSVVMIDGRVELQLLKWQVPVIGAIIAIAIAKHAFGGLGFNIWNPALAGRAFVQVAFPAYVSLSKWPWPKGTDAVTGATALAKAQPAAHTVGSLFVGYCPGCLGEVSALFLLIGALFLMAKKYVNWRLPLGYLLTLLVMATLFAWSAPANAPGWVQLFSRYFLLFREGNISFNVLWNHWALFAGKEIFAGGVVLGAFYMATDMVTSPYSNKGQFVFGVGCGLLTALLRFYSGYPEGVCYAILLMNTVRPYIDRFTQPRVLGESK
jgi:electron transport complex protein RnfD